MSILLGFLVYLPSVLAGGLLIHQLWPGNQPARLLIKLGLGTGLGLGLTSLLYFISLLIFNLQSSFLFIQLGLLATGLALTWMNRKRNDVIASITTAEEIKESCRCEEGALPDEAISSHRETASPKKGSQRHQFLSRTLFAAKEQERRLAQRLLWGMTSLQKLLLSAFGLLVFISIGSYFVHALMNPHGGFDAWMIYNRTARFFYRGQAEWLTAFSPKIYWQFHADYPLFLSLNVAGAWNTLGSESMRVAQAHGAYMLFGMVCLLMGAVAFTRTTGQSLLVGLVLLGTPVFVYEGPREAADLTLSFFVLATVILFFLYQRKQHPILPVLAGFATGLAAWTKNEGLLFILAVCLACALISFQLRNLKIIIPFLLGLAFPGAVILYFKLFLAPSNDLFANTDQTSLLQLLTNMDRYRLIFSEFIDHIVWFGRSHVSILAILLVYMLIVKLAPRASDRTAYLACGLILAVQFFGYFAIYLVTPHDLDWHLRTSLGRLIMQLYPAALFLFFASLSDPETVFVK